jgi:ligand-binding sensor domain-containing protein
MKQACTHAILCLAILAPFCVRAFALDPSLDVSQYAHTAWKIRDGFAKDQINAIAQTPDGYLWLGTGFGLLRFDGVRAAPWQPPNGEQLPSNFVEGPCQLEGWQAYAAPRGCGCTAWFVSGRSGANSLVWNLGDVESQALRDP